ncbi:hypothetical protein Tco_1448992 [Tanacetum coccineum]
MVSKLQYFSPLLDFPSSWLGLSFKMAEHVKNTVTRIVFCRIRDHEGHQFTILWSSRHFLRLHLKVKNVESQKEASEIGKFQQMDETVVAVVADIHSEGTTDLIAGGVAIVLCMAIKLETFCCTSDLSFVRVRSDPMDVAFTNAINMFMSQAEEGTEELTNRLMMGRELEGLSYKELDNLEPELHDGMLAPQLSIQKETTETFLIEPLISLTIEDSERAEEDVAFFLALSNPLVELLEPLPVWRRDHMRLHSD